MPHELPIMSMQVGRQPAPGKPQQTAQGNQLPYCKTQFLFLTQCDCMCRPSRAPLLQRRYSPLASVEPPPSRVTTLAAGTSKAAVSGDVIKVPLNPSKIQNFCLLSGPGTEEFFAKCSFIHANYDRDVRFDHRVQLYALVLFTLFITARAISNSSTSTARRSRSH